MITTNWSITQLFVTNRVITIYDDGRSIGRIILPSIKQVYLDRFISMFYTLMESNNMKTLKETLQMETNFEIVKNLTTNPLFTNIQEFSVIHQTLISFCKTYIENFKIENRILYINDTPLNDEIWNTIVNLIRQGAGHEEKKVPILKTEAAKKLYEQQLAAETKIAKMRSKNSEDVNGLMKVCLLITYAFPSYTVDALLELTMAQLIFLQSYAAKSCAYETESNAYANGNLKKPPKFFLE